MNANNAIWLCCAAVALWSATGCSPSQTSPSTTGDADSVTAQTDVSRAGDVSADAMYDTETLTAPTDTGSPKVDGSSPDATAILDASAETIDVLDPQDAPPEVPGGGDVEPDLCSPSCEGFQCGDDGCGGSCGLCADGLDCVSNLCVAPPCVPDCADAQCGDDGCGGSCGACQEGSSCIGITCVADCVPACEGKQCGPDGCGGNCEPNICAIGFACADGQCTQDCSPSCTGKVCGDNGCGGSCGACADTEACVAGQCEGPCVPDCVDKTCGADGCGGTCGKCTLPGTYCSDQGQCDNLGGSSCTGHCGGPNPNWPCQCDAFCIQAGNCCPDMCEVCGDLCP